MINLIPSEEKKRIIKDFYLRVVVVFLVVFSISIFILNLILIPALSYSSIKKNLSITQLEQQKNNPPVEFAFGAENLVENISKKINIINEAQKDKFLVSDKVINKILLKKTPGIKITEINYNNDITKGKSLDIRGEATTREALLVFKNTLERDTDFKRVDLPISNFIKSTNIQFNLVLIPI